MALPPGQRAVDGFPRFGTHLHRPSPAAPANPAIEITGAVAERRVLALADLGPLPRRELTADFHCVSGWSATGLRWEGIPFETFYRAAIEPSLPAGTVVTHLTFRGLDGHRSVVTLEDALAPDVLLAERLGGRPLDPDHGAPIRLLSPAQYGFISVKHLCRIEVHTSEPPFRGPLSLRLLKPHPRARVAEEERHQHLPAWLVRPVYRLAIAPLRALVARGDRSG